MFKPAQTRLREFLVGPTNVVLLAVALTGCGGTSYDLADVRGRVTLDGQPLPGAIVNTQPISASASSNPGPGSFGKTDDAGYFTLQLATRAVSGAVVGSHRVTIRIPDDGGVADDVSSRRDAGRPLPPEALDGSMTLEVPDEGLSSIELGLTTSRRR